MARCKLRSAGFTCLHGKGTKMPVIDETVVSKEIKAFKQEVREILAKFEERLAALEGKKAK